MFVCVTFPSSTGGRGVCSASLCDGRSRLRGPPVGSEMVSGGRKARQLRAATSLGAQTAVGRDKAVPKDQASELGGESFPALARGSCQVQGEA